MSRWRWALMALVAALSIGAPVQASGVAVWAIDGAGRVIPADRARASLERSVPEAEPEDPTAPHGDPDALRYLVAGPLRELPSLVDLVSVDEDGATVAVLDGAPLVAIPCPAAVGASHCAVTAPIRAVADEIDAGHPLVRSRSIVAKLGGGLRIAAAGELLATVRVAGPRNTAVGDIERFRARMRFVMVRLAPGGALPVGGDRQGALEVARLALERANALWGACGIGFGPADEAAIEIVDPPPPHLLTVGCGHGLPASGGRVGVSIGGRTIEARVDPGMLPRQAARRLAAALRAAGFAVRVSDNPRMAAGAHGTTDLSVRSRQGKLVSLAPPPGGQVSQDATLTACIGHVSLEDGLQHFGDVDAAVGTTEERSLIKAYDDFDPSTIDVYIVPGFARGGRIGESFIGSDGGAIRNVVIIDRAGIRSNQASFTLAHELGHVLLDDPGHPDDFGVDTPTRLMDADASDPTAFGPRRLALEECERAIRQSGPNGAVRILAPWPLAALPPP